MRFESVDASAQAQQAMHKRWFARRLISAIFLVIHLYTLLILKGKTKRIMFNDIWSGYQSILAWPVKVVNVLQILGKTGLDLFAVLVPGLD